MVDVREHLGGKALFASAFYKFGDVILDEEPLLCLDRLERSPSPTMTDIWSHFKKLGDKKKERMLNLFCPSDPDLREMDWHNDFFSSPSNTIVFGYDRVEEEARRFFAKHNDSTTVNELIRCFYIFSFNVTQYKGNKQAVFEFHARINHSCNPNSTFYAGRVRALKPIQPDELITIAYLTSKFLMCPTHVRRELLHNKFLFICHCTRCDEVIELCRTFRCPSCHRHSAVPGLSKLDQGGAMCGIRDHVITEDAMPPFAALEADAEKQVIKIEELLHRQSKPNDMPKLHRLHCNIVQNLGSCHWTAAFLTHIRYHNDPMSNGFITVEWGKSWAQWCKQAAPEQQWISDLANFAIGDGCNPDALSPKNGHFSYLGRKFWNDSYENC
jgi:hypothetical protein